jgi:uncharacterized membrane protein YecN with MAPEG domain
VETWSNRSAGFRQDFNDIAQRLRARAQLADEGVRKFQNEKQVSCYQYAHRRNHRVVVMLLSPAEAIVPIVIVAGLLTVGAVYFAYMMIQTPCARKRARRIGCVRALKD